MDSVGRDLAGPSPLQAQTRGTVDAFVMGAGTGGTLAGVSRTLKRRKADPRSRRRSLVSQLAPERTRMRPYSAVFSRAHCLRTPSYSRGARIHGTLPPSRPEDGGLSTQEAVGARLPRRPAGLGPLPPRGARRAVCAAAAGADGAPEPVRQNSVVEPGVRRCSERPRVLCSCQVRDTGVEGVGRGRRPAHVALGHPPPTIRYDAIVEGVRCEFFSRTSSFFL